MGDGNLWEQVVALLDGRMNRFILSTWFRPVSFLSDRDGLLRLGVPSVLFRDWFLARYAHVVDDALTHLGRPGTSVNYIVVPEPQGPCPSPFA